jgi:hypothetical protein
MTSLLHDPQKFRRLGGGKELLVELKIAGKDCETRSSGDISYISLCTCRGSMVETPDC